MDAQNWKMPYQKKKTLLVISYAFNNYVPKSRDLEQDWDFDQGYNFDWN